jgi:hypothetical protein
MEGEGRRDESGMDEGHLERTEFRSRDIPGPKKRRAGGTRQERTYRNVRIAGDSPGARNSGPKRGDAAPRSLSSTALTRHSSPICVTIRCGSATFSGVPSLVNVTFTT